MTRQELIAELLAAPEHRLEVWAVLYEDRYESYHGDGYYAYFESAYFHREEAERFAAHPGFYHLHLRKVVITCTGEDLDILPELQAHETILTGDLIASLSRTPSTRLPKSQY